MQILRDLGLVDNDGEGTVVLTGRGQHELVSFVWTGWRRS